MNQKIILIILGVVLLAVGGTVYDVILQKDQGVQETTRETSMDGGDSEIAPVEEVEASGGLSDVGSTQHQETATTISDWKTYVDEAYGVVFDYPRIYTINDDFYDQRTLEIVGQKPYESVSVRITAGFENFRWHGVAAQKFSYNTTVGEWQLLDYANKKIPTKEIPISETTSVYPIFRLSTGDAGYSSKTYVVPIEPKQIVVSFSFGYGGENEDFEYVEIERIPTIRSIVESVRIKDIAYPVVTAKNLLMEIRYYTVNNANWDEMVFRSETKVYTDGSWSFDYYDDASDKSGVMRPKKLTALTTLIQETDFDALRNATGAQILRCDSKRIFTFYFPTVEKIDTCETPTWSSSLFKELEKMRNSISAY